MSDLLIHIRLVFTAISRWFELLVYGHSRKVNDGEIWLFGSEGTHTSDALIELIRWIHEYLPEVICVALASTLEDIQKLDDIAITVSPRDSMLYTYMRKAKVAVTDTAYGYTPDPGSFYFLRKWHMYRPRYAEAFICEDENGINLCSQHYRHIQPDIITVSTKAGKDYLRGACLHEKDKVVLTGPPRADRVKELAAERKPSGKRKIAYVVSKRPWMNSTKERDVRKFEAYNRVFRFLNENNFQELLGKYQCELHAVIPWKLSQTGEWENIIIEDPDTDITALCADADILITDYSGCWLDMVLTGKPVLFYQFDRRQYYTDDRRQPTMLDMIGPVTATKEDAYEALEHILNGHDYANHDYILRQMPKDMTSTCWRIVYEIAKVEETNRLKLETIISQQPIGAEKEDI